MRLRIATSRRSRSRSVRSACSSSSSTSCSSCSAACKKASTCQPRTAARNSTGLSDRPRAGPGSARGAPRGDRGSSWFVITHPSPVRIWSGDRLVDPFASQPERASAGGRRRGRTRPARRSSVSQRLGPRSRRGPAASRSDPERRPSSIAGDVDPAAARRCRSIGPCSSAQVDLAIASRPRRRGGRDAHRHGECSRRARAGVMRIRAIRHRGRCARRRPC